VNEKQQIIFGETGQTLIWDAPEGRASAVNGVQVWRSLTGDLGTVESATTGSASIDAVNTTVDAASGPAAANPRKLNVAATTAMVVGRRYLVTAATGESEWILVTEIKASDYVICAHPLHNDYVNADSVVGTRLSISVHSTFVADTSKISDGLSAIAWPVASGRGMDPNPGYRVRWDYTVATIIRVHDAYFDLVRYAVQHTVQPIDMEALIPNWRDRLPTYHREDEGRRIIDEAARQVRWDFHESGLKLSSLRSHDGLDELVRQKAWLLLERDAVASGAGSTVVLELAMRTYQSRLDQLVRVSAQLPMSSDTSGRGTIIPARSITSK